MSDRAVQNNLVIYWSTIILFVNISFKFLAFSGKELASCQFTASPLQTCPARSAWDSGALPPCLMAWGRASSAEGTGERAELILLVPCVPLLFAPVALSWAEDTQWSHSSPLVSSARRPQMDPQQRVASLRTVSGSFSGRPGTFSGSFPGRASQCVEWHVPPPPPAAFQKVQPSPSWLPSKFNSIPPRSRHPHSEFCGPAPTGSSLPTSCGCLTLGQSGIHPGNFSNTLGAVALLMREVQISATGQPPALLPRLLCLEHSPSVLGYPLKGIVSVPSWLTLCKQ